MVNERKDFIARLREATGPMHQRLENTPISRALMQDDLSFDTYIEYLAHMRQVIAWSEQRVFPVMNGVLADIDSRRKLEMIDDDLAVLLGKGNTVKPVDFKGFTNATQSVGHALGHMYVMEGATLGGRVILQHIKKTVGLDENTGGTRFFAGYGAETGSRWKTFMNVLAERAVTEEIENDVISGAMAAFEQIEEYFAGSTVCR
jgi:heme oxygenase